MNKKDEIKHNNKKRKKKNWIVATLVIFVVISIYIISIVRMGE